MFPSDPATYIPSFNDSDKRKIFSIYLEKLVSRCNHYLVKSNKNIDMEEVRYVIIMEKKLMTNLCIDSRDELLQLIKENRLVDFEANPRKMVIVDQDEKLAWDMIESSQIPPESYYVHAHIAHDCIYLKLKQMIDVTVCNGEAPSASAVLIKDKFLIKQSVSNQVCETFWSYIDSLNKEERQTLLNNECDDFPCYVNDYKIFKEQFAQIIKENV